MSDSIRLHGIRVRDGRCLRVAAILLGASCDGNWRARISPPGVVAAGDRLRFGESAESNVCLLGFLDADVASVHDEDAILAFHLAGPSLDEALERLREPEHPAATPKEHS